MVSKQYDVVNMESQDFGSEAYQAINLHNFEQLEQIQALPDEVVYNINVVGPGAALQIEPVRGRSPD